MDNAKGPATTVRWTNGTSAAVDAGDVVVIGDHVGIAVGNITAGAEGVLKVEGEYELAANSAADWDLGDTLYFDATALELTTEASLNTEAGMATEDKAALTVLANVKINV